MAETPPNTPQRARIAAQQRERSNRTLDSPQRHRTPHHTISPPILPLHFNIPPPPPVAVPGDDPFAIPAPVCEPVDFNGHQYRHLPQHLAEALRNLQSEPPPPLRRGQGRGHIPPVPPLPPRGRGHGHGPINFNGHQYQHLPQHLADGIRNLQPEPPAQLHHSNLPQNLAQDYVALPPLQPLQWQTPLVPAPAPAPAPQPEPVPVNPPQHINIQAAMDAARQRDERWMQQIGNMRRNEQQALEQLQQNEEAEDRRRWQEERELIRRQQRYEEVENHTSQGRQNLTSYEEFIPPPSPDPPVPHDISQPLIPAANVLPPPVLPPPPPFNLPVQPLPRARQPFNPNNPNPMVHYMGKMDVVCSDCGALHWESERLVSTHKFGLCCFSGKIKIPRLDDPPSELLRLLSGQDDRAKKFRDRIRNYNNALAMTSLGCDQNGAINRDGGGPYVFKVQGRLYHRSGSLLPQPGSSPVYAQLYIYDPQEALDFRMNNEANTSLSRETMQTLQDMLYRRHPGVQLYKQAYELTRNMGPDQQCKIALRFDGRTDPRRYNLPTETSNEIAVILPGDGDQPTDGVRDIILNRRGGHLQEITDMHPLYPSLHYVLLFPTGQLQWHNNILHSAVDEKKVTQAEFFKYRLFSRVNESNHIFMAGKLFHEYVVDSWATTEQSRLKWVKLNQSTIRAETYQGLTDAVSADPNTDGRDLGQRLILPSSFTGSSRNMIQHCQDALAINRHFHAADFFLTMTADSNWPEIKEALLPGQAVADHPDLAVRVFHAKVEEIKADLFKRGFLGQTVAHVYTIEFQKLGLPHMHMIIFLHPDSKLRTPEDIDTLLSAEFPDEDEDPELLELVKKYMVHTPCGPNNPNAPCMKDGKCSKGFPKPFREETSINEDSYANLRRRNTGKTYEVRGHQVDNRWVVPYPHFWLRKFHCHINMECIFSIKAIKHIYKYVYKGHDRTTMEFGRCQDEIKLYLDSRYVSACEAVWRLLQFGMHEEEPNIVRLQVHLPNQQLITWNENNAPNVQAVVQQQGVKDTKLTAYFKANAEYPAARQLLYQDFPSKFVWKQDVRKWQPRKQGFAIGRMYYANPGAGERFYLRTLLATVKGATSFEDLRRVDGGDPLPTFHQACLARGLLEDDNEWRQCLQEAAHMASGHQLRNLFVTILRDCSPSDPLALWLEFRVHICDDLRHALHSRNIVRDPTEEQVFDYGLYLIDEILHGSNKSLRDWPTMPLPQNDWAAAVGNRLIAEQRSYNIDEQAQLATQRIQTLNAAQRSSFDAIVDAVESQSGQTFFLHGPGGTGKTYVYNTLCYFLRGQGKIVLCVASSGIASLLLMGGRTSHSTFKIPIEIHESSTCAIPRNSDLAELIHSTDLVIWDEAPMQHRHIHEAVDRTFQDIRHSDKQFGGLTIVFGGDFKQILPVIVKGS